MPKTKIDREKAEEGEIVETEWDFKRVLIGFVVISLLIIVAAYIFFPYSEGQNTQEKTLGASTQNSEDVPPLPDRDDIQKVISNAQKSLSEITADNLTASDAALQKIISDLQVLRGNKDAVGAICNLICKKE